MTTEEKIVKLLLEKKLILTTAESCTGGLIAKRITDVSGSSSVFECGSVSYSNRIKMKLLSVSEKTLNEFGAVSEQTAKEMAEGALKISNANLAVAVTGIAGPNSDDTNKPVGLSFIALSDGKTTKVKKLLNTFSDSPRENNRNASADMALEMILEYLSFS
ncbi:MAG: CinA family protein [Oscillospiraceae bacterium]